MTSKVKKNKINFSGFDLNGRLIAGSIECMVTPPCLIIPTQSGKRATVTVARNLSIRVRRMLLDQVLYEIGLQKAA